jgi:hypothetical protein
MTARTLLLSFWRNDDARQLRHRMDHLRKKMGIAHWLWVVGDSSDLTEMHLQSYADPKRVSVIRADTGIVGEDLLTRRRRISATETQAYAHAAAYDDIDVIIQHESDLRSPVDVVAQLTATLTPDSAVAGWPTLRLPDRDVFYDSWAYRGLDGAHFTNDPPYHAAYQRDTPFEVASVGSVWAAPREAWAGRTIREDCCVELCQQWRAEGRRIWVDPRVAIVQPRDLWEPPCS